MTDVTADDRFDDEQVLRAIGIAFDDALPPVPSHLSDFAVSAFRWRSIGDIGDLLSDSALDEAVGVRGSSSRRAVHFAMGRFRVMLDIADAMVHVSIEPPTALACLIETTTDSVEVESNASGQLSATVFGLPLRLRIDTGDGIMTSPWVIG